MIVLLGAQAMAQKLEVTVERFEAPRYPLVAGVARISGDVILFLTLNNNGTVASVRVGSGFPLFLTGSIEAAKKWRFRCWNCSFPNKYEHKLTFRYELKCIDEYALETPPIHPSDFHSYEFPDLINVNQCYPFVSTAVNTTRDPVVRKPAFPWSF